MSPKTRPKSVQPTARTLAAEVLVRVWKEAAFAAAVLDAALARHADLDPRDRGLATEITYGTLRTAPFLAARLDALATRGIGKLDDVVRAHLLVAAYQLLFLDRVPAFAAVSEAVDRIRAERGAQVGGFANAILRKLAESAKQGRPALEEAVRESAAPWLREALGRALGDAGANAFLEAGPVPPPIGLRVRLGADRAAWIERLRAAAPGALIEAGRASPIAILVRGAGDPRGLPGFAEGDWTVQEEGSQLVALAVGARPGDRVLDACAGRGNKTSLLAEASSPGGAVDAADLHEQKLERLVKELARVGRAPRATYAVDWSVGPGDVPRGYDRVLVDAPCSGIGTLRRRPELATRRAQQDLALLASLQEKVLLSAATRVRSGGSLIYAVCSVLREEAEGVVLRVLSADPSLAAAPFPDGPMRERAGDRTALRLLPQDEGTDGYFVASFTRR